MAADMLSILVWAGVGYDKTVNSSFLKKRSKKLLMRCPCPRSNLRGTADTSRNKSFLVLFFKKERLPCFFYLA
jgi:hypothetical protein